MTTFEQEMDGFIGRINHRDDVKAWMYVAPVVTALGLVYLLLAPIFS